jgi:hypothetical protein
MRPVKKKPRGGTRKGAGRPKGSGKKEETVVMRVPKRLKEIFETMKRESNETNN